MKQKKYIWITIYVISMGAFLLFVTGFAWGLSAVLFPNNQLSSVETVETSFPSSEQEFLVGLGDSLTRGIGDEKGLGYIGVVRNVLQQELDEPVHLSNLAISGQTSSQLKEQVTQSQVKELLGQAKWITLTIGGNDLNRSSNPTEDELDVAQARQSKKQYEQNIKQILTTIRQENKTAPVFLFSLYNPYEQIAEADGLVLEWNETIQVITQSYPDVVMIPVYDLFQLNPNNYLSSDAFHPNTAGYERMAERLLQVIRDTEMRTENESNQS